MRFKGGGGRLGVIEHIFGHPILHFGASEKNAVGAEAKKLGVFDSL